MTPVTLLLADDEEDVRQAIIELIPWEANGIRLCAVASNGLEALELIEMHHPDILLIDVRMPHKNGLEVIAALEGKPVNAIVLSGYDDFTYAQKAIKCGAKDYLLKPSRPQDILAAVLKQRDIVLDRRNQDKLIFGSRQMILNQVLQDIVDTRDGGYLEQCLESIGVSGYDGDFFCVVVRSKETLPPLQRFCHLAQQNLGERFCACGVVDAQILVLAAGLMPRRDLTQILLSLKSQIDPQRLLSIGVGLTVTGALNITQAYHSAEKAADMSFFLGNDYVHFFEHQHRSGSGIYPAEEEKDIQKALELCDEHGCKAAVDAFLDALHRQNAPKAFVIKCCTWLSMSLYNFCDSKGVALSTTLSDGLTLLDELQRLDSAEDVSARLLALCADMLRRPEGTDNKFVDLAKVYIAEHYAENLSLSVVAQHVSITPGYLCTLFRKCTQKSFVDYVHEVRIAKACKLLRNVRLKNYEVAFAVGYNDEKYFTRLFKRLTGLTPSEYRQQN